MTDPNNIDFKAIIAEYVLTGVFDKTIKAIKKIVVNTNSSLRKKEEKIKAEKQAEKERKEELIKQESKRRETHIFLGEYNFESTAEELQQQLEHILKNAFNWSSDISFRDLPQSKSLIKTFIELDFYLTPRKIHFDEFEEPKKIKLFDAIQHNNKNAVILGAPGAGKTTVGKYLCTSLILKNEPLSEKYNFPLVIRLRDYNQVEPSEIENYTLLKLLYNILDLKLFTSDSPTNAESTSIKILAKVIDSLKLFIIIDGYDEIVNPVFKKRIVSDLDKLCHSITEGRVLLTSRAADFKYTLANSETYEICPLSPEQIEEFTFKWLENEERAKILQQQIFSSPFSDTAMRPLTLAHLCAIFERYGKIPPKPKSVYKKVIELLLEEWDTQRGIERITEYTGFEIDRKREFLSRLAYELTTRYHTYTFNKYDLQKCFRLIHEEFDLPEKQMDNIINEIESHNGLFVQSGNDRFEFAHKSLQEYLTAAYISKLDEIPHKKGTLSFIPNELAIALTLSSDQSSFFTTLILNRLRNDSIEEDFILPFLTRLAAEKPNFRKSEDLGISFLYLYSTLMLRSYDYYEKELKRIKKKKGKEIPENDEDDEMQDKKENNMENIITLLSYFFDLPVIQQSLSMGRHLYQFNGDTIKINLEQPSIHYIIKAINKHKGPVKKKYPLTMIVNQQVASLLKKK